MRDTFVKTQFKTALLYFAFMFLTVSLSGLMTDHLIANIVSNAFTHAVLPSAEAVTAEIDRVRAIARILNIVFFAIGAYLLLGLTLRPIKELVEAQRQFIANVSHELRTPLTIMKTEAEVAWRTREKLSKEEALDLLQKNLGRVDHVSRIIQFFLILSDYNKQGSQELDRVVSLRQIISKAEGQLADNIRAKDITVNHSELRQNVTINGNPMALEKMILNLLRNALAYAPHGSKIELGLKEEADSIILSVSDSGVGITKEELPRVFEPFLEEKMLYQVVLE